MPAAPATTPRRSPPSPWARSKKPVTVPTTAERSEAGAEATANDMSAGYSRAMPTLRTAVPTHSPGTDRQRPIVTSPTVIADSAVVPVRAGPQVSGILAPRIRMVRTIPL